MNEVIAYSRYEWDCDCGETNEVDHDPQGETVDCEGCGDQSHVRESL